MGRCFSAASGCHDGSQGVLALSVLLSAVALRHSEAAELELGHAKACIPRWYRLQHESWLANGSSLPEPEITCPSGVRLPGDITWRNDVNDVANAICVVYGYVPMLVIGIAILEFLIVRGTRELFFVLYVAFTTALNEVVVKAAFHQPRPRHSCATTCGMPSSHSSFAMGFYVLMFLDAASRVNPMDVGGEASHMCVLLIQKDFAFLRGPLSNPVTLSNCAFIYSCFQWGVLLLPVPLTRIFLRDHTTGQVIAGSTCGVIYAFVFFFGVYEPFAKIMVRHENWRWPVSPRRNTHLLKNTIKLPWWRTEVDQYSLQIVYRPPDDTDVTAESSETDPEASVVSEPSSSRARKAMMKFMKSGHQDSFLVSGRSLTAVEVPAVLLDPAEGEGSDAETSGSRRGRLVVHGQKLQVVGGNWSGVAWPLETETKQPLDNGTPYKSISRAEEDDDETVESLSSSSETSAQYS